MLEREPVLMDHPLQLAIDRERGGFVAASAVDILAPPSEAGPSVRARNGFVIGDIINGAAKCVKRGHAVAFLFWQQDESERKIGGAFPSDRPAFLHRLRLGRWRRAERR